MSSDRELLARVIQPLCDVCRICGCRGDECSLPQGERCSWMDRLRTLCSNPACIMAALRGERKTRREREREEKRAANAVPEWMQRRKREEMARRRRRTKVKGRAA